MKTIDEQLNIINDTKNGIAQVLNSKGVEVTADTKFADYPDKVAQLMGNTEVDASVSAALTEVTAEYLEQVNAVKAQADGLEESKLDVSVAEATYQPKGNYLTEHQDISGKLDVSVAAETYQPKGAYLTEHQDISGKLDASVAEATYQPKGDYLTQHQDISGKLDVSVAAETYATKQEVNSAGYLTQHQDISGKLDASVAEATYQPKGAYLTEHQDISGKLDASVAEATYQPKGDYLTQHQDISGKLDASVAAETYQPKGNYQPAGNYLTEHQDISGKLDASVAAETYQPKGAYLTEHQSLADYALKSELPLVPTNVSAFTNDAGYLTSHQDISNLLDVSTAAATYATASALANATTVVSGYTKLNSVNQLDTFDRIVIDFHSLTGEEKTEASRHWYEDIHMKVTQHPLYSGREISYGFRYNEEDGHWYTFAYGTGTASRGVAGDGWLDMEHTWDPYGGTNYYYRVAGNPTMTWTVDPESGVTARATFDFATPVTAYINSEAEASDAHEPASFYGTHTSTLKQYVDSRFATVPTKTSDLTNDSSFISEHQDISGKLDASVAAATYQPIGNYLTQHQSLANYATKADIDGGNHYAFRYNPTDASNNVSLNGETVKFSEISFVWEAYEDKQSSISMGTNPLYIQFSSGTNVYGQASGFTIGTSPMTLTCGSQTAEVVSYSWDGSVLTQKSRFATPIEGTINKVTPGTTRGIRCNGTLDLQLTWKEYVDTNFLTEEQDIDHKLDASVAAATYALKADIIYAECDVSTNHGATDDLSTTPVTFTCDKMKFTCEGGWSGMANTSEKSVGLTITCDEGTVKLIKLNGVFTLTTAYSSNEVTEANTITTVKESNFTYNLNEITFNDKVTLTNVTAVSVYSFGSNVQMTTTEHVVTTVKQKIAQLEALIATLHPQS